MCNKCLAKEIEDLQAKLSSTKAELSGVRLDLAGTTTTLDKYRDMHEKMSRVNSNLRRCVSDLDSANSDLRKCVSDQEDTIRTLMEERDLSRELFQGMVSAYADLLDRYSKMCDDDEELVSLSIWRDDVEND